VDTLSEVITTDSIGRRGGARHRRSIKEKRRIVEETLVPDTSVAVIARKYEVNANQVFAWRRLYQQGLLEVRDGGVRMAMLPVAPVLARRPRVKRAKRAAPIPSKRKVSESIEIRLPNGGQISLPGSVDPKALTHIISLIVRT
jgi:transposase